MFEISYNLSANNLTFAGKGTIINEVGNNNKFVKPKPNKML